MGKMTPHGVPQRSLEMVEMGQPSMVQIDVVDLDGDGLPLGHGVGVAVGLRDEVSDLVQGVGVREVQHPHPRVFMASAPQCLASVTIFFANFKLPL